MKQRFMLNALILLSIVTVAHAGVDVQPTKPARNMIFNSVKNNKTASPVIDLSNNSATKSGMQLPVMYNDTDFAAEPIQNVTKTPVVSEKPNKIISSPKQQPILPKADSVMPTFEIDDALPKLSGDIAPISESENNIVINRSMQNPINFADDAKSVDTPSVDTQEDTSVESKQHKVPVAVQEQGVLYQSKIAVHDEATIAFNFEEASLFNLMNYIESVHNIKFIADDIIAAKGANTPTIAGHKISFRTNKNLTRHESWNLFLSFMNMAGFDVIPMPQQDFYRVVPLPKANNEPIPTYIGVDASVLPESDMIIRFVYFTRNIDPARIQPLLKNMQSASAKLDVYNELKGLIFTDRACSIKSLMQIVTELDRAVLPEVVSVVKLQRANVEDVISLYKKLKPANTAATGQPQKVWVQSKKESTLDYFPSDVALVGDTRTNSLILLGTARDVKRIEDFVTQYIDIAVDRSAPPIFTYKLQYTNATDIQKLLSQIVQYGKSTPAGQVGGVRDGIKFFQPMNIVPDSFTNSLIINAMPEDYEMLEPLIKELDVPQRQIGIEVLIVQVSDTDNKTLGAQISGPNGAGSPLPWASPYGPTFFPGASAQTSGIPQGTPVVVTAGQPGQDDFSIKSSLASLLSNPSLNEVGSVLLTFGRPIWAIFKVLKTITSTHIISNPFLVATNNTSAQFSSGEERRQVSGEVVSAQGQTTRGYVPVDANLTLNIRPQINTGNIINLDIFIENSVFTQAMSLSSQLAGPGSPRDTKSVQTTVSVANGETLVIGGIMSESYATTANGVPFLENIPVFGWLFKSKNRKVNRDHFMIFICPRLLDPLSDHKSVDDYTKYKLSEVQEHLDLIDESDWFVNRKDPIQKAFFGSDKSPCLQQLATGKFFERQERLDGIIDEVNDNAAKRDQKKQNKKNKSQKSSNAQRSKSAKNKKNKKQQDMMPVLSEIPRDNIPVMSKNSIINSVSSPKEVVYGA